MELLYAAWPQAKVAALMEFNALGPHLADVEFCAIYSTAESDEHLPSAPGTTGRDASATIPGQEYGVVADNRGHVAALLKPAAAEADDTMIVTIREMAARSDCRGRGLGTMMLGHVRRVTNEMLGRVPGNNSLVLRAGTRSPLPTRRLLRLRPWHVRASLSTVVCMPADATHPHVVTRDW